jgi:hypothetical protein
MNLAALIDELDTFWKLVIQYTVIDMPHVILVYYSKTKDKVNTHLQRLTLLYRTSSQ